MRVRVDETFMGFGDVTRCERDEGTEKKPKGTIENDEISSCPPAYVNIQSVYLPVLVFLSVIRATRHSGLDSRAIRRVGHTKFRSRETDTSRTSNHR